MTDCVTSVFFAELKKKRGSFLRRAMVTFKRNSSYYCHASITWQSNQNIALPYTKNRWLCTCHKSLLCRLVVPVVEVTHPWPPSVSHAHTGRAITRKKKKFRLLLWDLDEINLHTELTLLTAGVYPCFYSMKPLKAFLLLLDGRWAIKS